MTLADVMVENLITYTKVEVSKCHIAEFISPPYSTISLLCNK